MFSVCLAGDIGPVLADAKPAVKAKVYKDTLGLHLVYLPEEAKVLVTATPAGHVPKCVSEGGLEPPRPKGH